MVYLVELLYLVCKSRLAWCVQGADLCSCPVKRSIYGVVVNIIIPLWHTYGCWGHLLSVDLWEELVMFGAILLLIENSCRIHPSSLPLNQ